MFHTRAIAFLMQLSVVAVVGMIWACRTYWPNLPTEAVWILVFGGFLSGGICTGCYMLIRYRHELTPEVKS